MEYESAEFQTAIPELSGQKHLERIELYPGMELSFVSFGGEDSVSFRHPPMAYILEINYCIAGRIGWHMDNGNQIYLGPGDFSLHTMDVCAHSRITLPNGHYRGMILWIDLKRLSSAPPFPLVGCGITGEFLHEKFCKDGACTALTGNEKIQRIFSAFYETPEQLRLSYQKIKTLELLLALSVIEVKKQRRLTEYRFEQVEIIRKVHDQMTENLSQRISIESLAKQYLINATTLKEMFKSIYGASIAAHIREHRMEGAAELLLSTDLSIAQIAAKVGYDSQSRFSSSFKQYFGMLPKEYRRQRDGAMVVEHPRDSGLDFV